MHKLIFGSLLIVELVLVASTPVFAEPEVPIIQQEFERVVNKVDFTLSDISNIKSGVIRLLNSKDKKIVNSINLQTIRNLASSACHNNQSFGFYAFKGKLQLEKGQTYALQWAYLVTSQELSNPYPVKYRPVLPAIYSYVVTKYPKCVYSH
ncbi:hypothetical protein DSM106972_048890 [Dulcicalothrix desertica PCC 7102]|uniref:Uncharacterized protein n=1 Tax=Dulcicalothrix desertica PCC 7102 TaxID=232991 RepID=A0A433VCZ1_9CYAN|nr:hypothetical protein [Dulcicalothrix desertica]RUT03975.1 hypothetical protein DSM106972_048890 [Dulcicalothrix desertica PCC 7102]TWH43618.1 hypothetical protein CAL7102_07355 [Dulcicalothrix desertica PCC 7102]